MVCRFNHCAGEHEIVRIQLLYFIGYAGIPAGAQIHIIIHIHNIVLCGEAPGLVHSFTDACIVFGMRKIKPFVLCPLQRSIAAIINVQYHLVAECRVLPDALHAQFYKINIIPGGYDDREHYAGSFEAMPKVRNLNSIFATATLSS